jgi:hypothetical protein
VPLLLTICGARASDAVGFVCVEFIDSDSCYAEFLFRLRGFSWRQSFLEYDPIEIGSLKRQRRSAPSPLVGEGWGGG